MKQMTAKEVEALLSEGKRLNIIDVCRSGGRSGQASRLIESYGFNVINMVGGMLAWKGNVQ